MDCLHEDMPAVGVCPTDIADWTKWWAKCKSEDLTIQRERCNTKRNKKKNLGSTVTKWRTFRGEQPKWLEGVWKVNVMKNGWRS